MITDASLTAEPHGYSSAFCPGVGALLNCECVYRKSFPMYNCRRQIDPNVQLKCAKTSDWKFLHARTVQAGHFTTQEITIYR